MKYLGASYYPESWGIDRVATDIKLFKEAGMNMVRVGEFAWSKMEPRQGEYDFDLFRKAVDMFAENNINVMMCTPTAAPPAWLTHSYPETLVKDDENHSAFHGIRQQCCYNSDLFIELSCKVTDELSRRLADCSNIPIWQLDNELGQRLFGFCHCEKCQRDFRIFLKNRYQTLDRLNACWKNEFWSQDYSAWDQIELAFLNRNHSVSRVLDSMRFYQDTIRDYALAEAEIIRKNIPGVQITTNNPVGCLDLPAIYEKLDCASGDFYWDNRNPAAMTLRLSNYRSFKKKPFFIAEFGLYSDIYPDASGNKSARLDMWRSFAHGAISYLMFRWRPPLGGQEQTAQGAVSPSGKPRRNYKTLKTMFTEAKALEPKLAGIQLPKASAAMMLDSDVDKVYMRHGWGRAASYNQLIINAFEQMTCRNIAADVVSPHDSLEQYKLLVLPSQRISLPETSRRIKEFIRSGGVVWALGECHNADENANFTLIDSPAGLTEEFGLNIEFGAPLSANNERAKTTVAGTINGKAVSSEIASGWIADIDLLPGAECLLRFADGYYAGQPAVVCNKCGDGFVVYQGISNAAPELLHEIAQLAVDKAQIDYCRNCPAGVEIIDCGTAVFIINSNRHPVSFKYPARGAALLGDFDPQTQTVNLSALDLCIISISAIQ